MIWPVVLNLKQIQQFGKNFDWPRPQACLRCDHFQVWGHGYALRYFDGFYAALPMKCYRCPQCGCVITARPAAYFPRIRRCIATIVTCLRQRLEQGRWPALGLSRSRLRHWLKNLVGQVRIHLTEAWSDGLLAGYTELLARGLIPVARVS